MRKNIYKKKNGFSLIETLIAVSILMIAIAGPLSLVQAGLFSSIHQRNQVTAIFLAQEAMEFVKNLRDTKSYQQYIASPPPSTDWLVTTDGVNLLDACSVACYVDPHGNLPLSDGNNFVQSVGLRDLHLKKINIGGIYLYSYRSQAADIDTIYQRKVIITPISSDEVTVSVRMDWKDNTLSRWYTVSENIYNYEQ